MSAVNAASEPCFSHLQRVYWEDTDAGGVVFYANYLKFFERARTEWLRAMGIEQQALREQSGAIFVVSDTQLNYKSPARLDDLLRITVAVDHCASASMRMTQQAWKGDVLVAAGQIRIACVAASSFKPRRIPEEVTALVQAALTGLPPKTPPQEPLTAIRPAP